jgi:hypothetical protein
MAKDIVPQSGYTVDAVAERRAADLTEQFSSDSHWRFRRLSIQIIVALSAVCLVLVWALEAESEAMANRMVTVGAFPKPIVIANSRDPQLGKHIDTAFRLYKWGKAPALSPYMELANKELALGRSVTPARKEQGGSILPFEDELDVERFNLVDYLHEQSLIDYLRGESDSVLSAPTAKILRHLLQSTHWTRRNQTVLASYLFDQFVNPMRAYIRNGDLGEAKLISDKAQKIMGLVDPDPSLRQSSPTLANAFDSMLLLGVYLEDSALWITEPKAAKVILKALDNLDDDEGTKAQIVQQIAVSSTDRRVLTQWKPFIEALMKSTARNWDEAINRFRSVEQESTNRRMKDLALLGIARATFWMFYDVPGLRNDSDMKELTRVQAAIEAKNLANDVDFYKVRMSPARPGRKP